MAPIPGYITCLCTANTCRSPMAERLLAHALKAEDEPLRSIPVISAGISSYEGERASENSIRALQKVSLDLSDHFSHSLTQEIVDNSLVFFCMTDAHQYLLKEFFPGVEAPVLLFRQFIDPPANTQLPDPYGMPLEAYENCRDNLVEAIPSCIQYLRENLAPNLK